MTNSSIRGMEMSGMDGWRTMDTFIPPRERPMNKNMDHARWFWLTWGGSPILCRFEAPGIFIPIGGGMATITHPKYWMPLKVPPAPLPDL